MASSRGARNPAAAKTRVSRGSEGGVPEATDATTDNPTDAGAPAPDPSKVMQLVDPNNVAEVYASEAAMVDAENGIVTTTYVVHRVLGQNGPTAVRKNVVVSRVAMPISAAYALRRKLDRILSAYEAMNTPAPPGKAN